MTFCFRYISVLIPVITIAATTGISNMAVAQESDLFSAVNPKSAFAVSPDTPSTRSTTVAVTSGEQLREMLKSAGFEAKMAGSMAASTTKEIDPWTIPVLVTLSEDERWVQVVLGLTVIKDSTNELTAEKLLNLMKASQDQAPVNFVYHSERKRIEVEMTLRNQDLSGTELRNQINRLAIAARKTSDQWASDLQKQLVAQKQPVVPPTTPLPNLAGQWVASKSATEAFALDLAASGDFKLVYIKDAQQIKSSGKYSVSDSSLTLSGGNLNLVGTLQVTSATEFSFTPAKQPALKFVKAK
ncbi:MAG: hypothetical protein ABJZ55_17465 [Fuerstiella sp.]